MDLLRLADALPRCLCRAGRVRAGLRRMLKLRRLFELRRLHELRLAPPSGYSSCSSCGGCSACGSSFGGCPSCSAGANGSFAPASGCPSCTAGTTVLPGPAAVAQPPLGRRLAAPMTTGPAPGTTIGPPATAPGPAEAAPPTYAPNSGNPPIAPSCAERFRRQFQRQPDLALAYDQRCKPSDRIAQGQRRSAGDRGPQLSPPPVPRPEGSDRMTSRPVSPSYFQLLPSPPATVPAQTVGLPKATSSLPADDGGWVPAK